MLGNTEADPDQKGYSKIISARSLGVGDHTLTVAHKRAVPEKKTFTIKINKGQISRPQLIEMWIADTVVTMKNGMSYTGRLHSQTDKDLYFEPEPHVRQKIEKSELKSIVPLTNQE